jgi:hypothetical protein
MAHITRVVSVKVDPIRLIDYIVQINNHPAFIPPLKSIDNVQGDPKQAGATWNWTFIMAGVELTGTATTVAYTPGKVFSYKTAGGIDSTFTYSVEPEAGGSRFSMDVLYELPQTLLAKVADKALIERLNDEQADQTVKNVKAILEAAA